MFNLFLDFASMAIKTRNRRFRHRRRPIIKHRHEGARP
jgi:hypothetical protein